MQLYSSDTSVNIACVCVEGVISTRVEVNDRDVVSADEYRHQSSVEVHHAETDSPSSSQRQPGATC